MLLKSTFLASFFAHDARLPLHPCYQRCKKLCFTRLLRWLGVDFPWLLWIWASRAFILLYLLVLLVFVKTVSPPLPLALFSLPRCLYCPHVPSTHAHHIYLDMKCLCKDRDVKTTPKRSEFLPVLCLVFRGIKRRLQKVRKGLGWNTVARRPLSCRGCGTNSVRFWVFSILSRSATAWFLCHEMDSSGFSFATNKKILNSRTTWYFFFYRFFAFFAVGACVNRPTNVSFYHTILSLK